MAPRLLRSLALALTGSRPKAGAIVGAWLFLAFLAFYLSPPIRIDSRLEALLDDDAPSIVALHELRDRRDTTGVLVLAVQSDDPTANARFIADLARAVRTWPEVEYVEVERDYTPIRDHALYYLDVEDLQKIVDELKRRKQIAVARSMAAGLDKEDGTIDTTQVLSGDDWEQDQWAEPAGDTADTHDGGEEPPLQADAQAADEGHPDLRQMLSEQREALRKRELVPDKDFDLVWPNDDALGQFPWQDHVAAPYADETGTLHLLRAHLDRPATDLEFAAEITARSQALIADLKPESYARDMRTEVGGNYASSTEVTSIAADLQTASLASGAAVLTVLLLGLRAPRGLLLVLSPVAVAVLLTLALAATLFHELNLLSAFLFAVLLGIGVDFGVYLFALRRAQGPVADWPTVFVQSASPLASSMVTTAASFLVLTAASFRGFREFGVLAAVGVVVSFVVAFTMVPAFDTLLGPIGSAPAVRRDSVCADSVGQAGRLSPARRVIVRAMLTSAVVIVALIGAPDLAFETDMTQLRAPPSETQDGLAYSRAMGKGSASPVVLLAPNAAVLDEAMARLERDANTSLFAADSGKAYAGEPWLRDYVSLRQRLPKEVERKIPLLEQIHGYANAVLGELPDLPADDELHKLRTHVEALAKLSAAPPLQVDDMPTWAREPFLEKSGHVDRLGLFSPRIPTYDLEQAAAMTEHFRQLMDGLPVRAASSRFVMGDLTTAVVQDTERLPGYALLTILVILGVTLREVRGTLACFASLCLGLGLTFGLMGLASIHLNFYNLVIMPAVIGLGIDASIHLWHSRKTSTSGATTVAAAVAALTTAGGFLGLALAAHKGLQSIGVLGLLATLATVATAMLTLAPLGKLSGPGRKGSSFNP